MMTYQNWRDVQRENNPLWLFTGEPGSELHKHYSRYAEAFRAANLSGWAIGFGK